MVLLFPQVMNVICRILRGMLFLWLGLTLVAPSLHGIVLCADGHGHVAIEPAHQEHGCCQDHEEDSAAPAKEISAVLLSVIPGHGCSDCTDIPLSTDNASLLIKKANRNGLGKTKLMLVADDMSAIMNESVLREVRSAPLYDRPLGRSHLLIVQKITVLRV